MRGPTVVAVEDADVAVAAAAAGANVVRASRGRTGARVDKGGGDFATEVDLRAEEAILDVIRSNRPADAVTAEESGETGSRSAGRRWFVDPLCGTVNFDAGVGPV